MMQVNLNPAFSSAAKRAINERLLRERGTTELPSQLEGRRWRSRRRHELSIEQAGSYGRWLWLFFTGRAPVIKRVSKETQSYVVPHDELPVVMEPVAVS